MNWQTEPDVTTRLREHAEREARMDLSWLLLEAAQEIERLRELLSDDGDTA